jgi:hypothetical protein
MNEVTKGLLFQTCPYSKRVTVLDFCKPIDLLTQRVTSIGVDQISDDPHNITCVFEFWTRDVSGLDHLAYSTQMTFPRPTANLLRKEARAYGFTDEDGRRNFWLERGDLIVSKDLIEYVASTVGLEIKPSANPEDIVR